MTIDPAQIYRLDDDNALSGQTVVHDDNPMIRGMIFKVKHMVDVEEVQE